MSDIYKNFYPSCADNEFFMKEKENIISSQINLKIQKREKNKQKIFSLKRYSKEINDPEFDNIKNIYSKLYGEKDTKYINFDDESMLIIRNGKKLKEQ